MKYPQPHITGNTVRREATGAHRSAGWSRRETAIRDVAFSVIGRSYRFSGMPSTWVPGLSPRLAARMTAASGSVHRQVVIEPRALPELRPPDEPHDLNETTRLSYTASGLHLVSDWCEASISMDPVIPVRLVVHPSAEPWAAGIIENVLRCLVAYDALGAGGVMLHSAALVRDNHAVGLFGHSGVGKSTAAMAALNCGASVISDDINVLLPEDGGWNVVPVPFGALPPQAVSRPRPVPLIGLFSLHKAEVNRLRECSEAHAVSQLMACSPFLNHDPLRADVLLDVLIRLAQDLRVRELHFSLGSQFLDMVLP